MFKNDEKIIIGRKSPTTSVLADFESISPQNWKAIKEACRIPDYFLFLVGVARYPAKNRTPSFKFSGHHVFVQSMLPHRDAGVYNTRNYGAFWSKYEPEERADDDMVFDESAVYQAMPDNRVTLIFGDGEHRSQERIAKVFHNLRGLKGLYDFSKAGCKPELYEVFFKTKSCGYFLKGRKYQVWATPVGIPDQQTGTVAKGWLFCDINCGVPGVITAEREKFIPLPMAEGSKIGLYAFRNGLLEFDACK